MGAGRGHGKGRGGRTALAPYTARPVSARARLALVLAASLGLSTACASRRAAPADETAGADEATLAADLELLCRRVEARNVSAWSQPVLQTRALTELTMRVDRGEAAARCQLGRLMRAHARRTCAHVSDGLVDDCE